MARCGNGVDFEGRVEVPAEVPITFFKSSRRVFGPSYPIQEGRTSLQKAARSVEGVEDVTLEVVADSTYFHISADSAEALDFAKTLLDLDCRRYALSASRAAAACCNFTCKTDRINLKLCSVIAGRAHLDALELDDEEMAAARVVEGKAAARDPLTAAYERGVPSKLLTKALAARGFQPFATDADLQAAVDAAAAEAHDGSPPAAQIATPTLSSVVSSPLSVAYKRGRFTEDVLMAAVKANGFKSFKSEQELEAKCEEVATTVEPAARRRSEYVRETEERVRLLEETHEALLFEKDDLAQSVQSAEQINQMLAADNERLAREREQLEANVRRAEDALPTCAICLDRRPDVAFEPCHHVNSCQACAATLPTCPTCRAPITAKNPVFI